MSQAQCGLKSESQVVMGLSAKGQWWLVKASWRRWGMSRWGGVKCATRKGEGLLVGGNSFSQDMKEGTRRWICSRGTG